MNPTEFVSNALEGCLLSFLRHSSRFLLEEQKLPAFNPFGDRLARQIAQQEA